MGIDASSRLDEASAATRRGDHQEALEGFRWFHEHALDREPSLSGVRLSFALSYWHELAEVYPPAEEAMRATREAAEQRALDPAVADDERVAAFADACSLDKKLGEEHRAVEVLRQLQAESPAVSRAAARWALDAVIAEGDPRLALECLGDPEVAISRTAMALTVFQDEEHLQLNQRYFVRRVRKFVSVVADAGEPQRVPGLLAFALAQAPEDQREVLAAELSVGA